MTQKRHHYDAVFDTSFINFNIDLVPMVGLEPTRLSPPPPQDGVSTNSTTSALNFLGVLGPIARPRADIDCYFPVSVAGASGLAGRAGATGTSEAGAGCFCVFSAGTAGAALFAGATDSATLPRSIFCPERYASDKLVMKNRAARIPVARDRKLPDPRAPKTVAEAPLPKAAPASAPLPC